jgi:PAS domain S-box-containing protein
MGILLRTLIVEDSEDDALFVVRVLQKGGYDPEYERVETADAMREALERQIWDIIISDYKMPHFSGLAALKLYKEKGLNIPFIIVSGTIGEEAAVAAMVSGAHDYVMKNNLPRLVPAIQRELRDAESRKERKRAEEELKLSEKKYRSIFENAVEGIYQTTPGGRYIAVNPALARMMGYDTSEELIEGVTDISKQIYVNPEDSERYKKILAEEGIVQGFEARHYRKDKSIIWVSINTCAVRDPADKMLYYEGTVEDITARKTADERLKQHAEKLKKSLFGTIKALSMTVEARDPYTSGHQTKVSRLARAIAQDMALSNDTIDNIRIAGSIHDIGKISVPSEILSKPGKLTDIEFSLIKNHSQSGYDILRDAELPYSIAKIVLQHHERLDGSGYPQGLRNGQILLESKVVMVADVVEAMASYRPYRPALGIPAALEEIEKNKETLYDVDVVDACLRLFRGKGYQLEKV